MANMAEVKDNFTVSPLRSLDEFITDSARFQIPNVKDPDKWANRVIQNLLYYQTNYFLTYFVVFAVVGVIHPTKMFCGMVAMGLAFGLFYYLTNNKQPAVQFKKDHPVLSVIVLVMGSYFIVYLLGSVVVFLLGILLPIIVIFIHASMRLRNLKNKLMNKIEYVGLKKTPMGVILDALGLEQEFLMDSPAKYFPRPPKMNFEGSSLNLDTNSKLLDSVMKLAGKS